MNQIVDIDIATIKGASYNPREITDEKISGLQESIMQLGIIKPVIVRKEDGTILAGHQRTKSATLNGWTSIKGFFLSDVNSTDEVSFNQLHITKALLTISLNKRCHGKVEDKRRTRI